MDQSKFNQFTLIAVNCTMVPSTFYLSLKIRWDLDFIFWEITRPITARSPDSDVEPQMPMEKLSPESSLSNQVISRVVSSTRFLNSDEGYILLEQL